MAGYYDDGQQIQYQDDQGNVVSLPSNQQMRDMLQTNGVSPAVPLKQANSVGMPGSTASPPSPPALDTRDPLAPMTTNANPAPANRGVMTPAENKAYVADVPGKDSDIGVGASPVTQAVNNYVLSLGQAAGLGSDLHKQAVAYGQEKDPVKKQALLDTMSNGVVDQGAIQLAGSAVGSPVTTRITNKVAGPIISAAVKKFPVLATDISTPVSDAISNRASRLINEEAGTVSLPSSDDEVTPASPEMSDEERDALLARNNKTLHSNMSDEDKIMAANELQWIMDAKRASLMGKPIPAPPPSFVDKITGKYPTMPGGSS